MNEDVTKEGGTEQFAILLKLAKQIAENHKPKSFIIVRTRDDKWLVTLLDPNIRNQNPLLQLAGGKGRLEDALEAFIINPLG